MTQVDPESPGARRRNPLYTIVLIGFILAAALTAYLTFKIVRDFVTSFEMASLPGVAIQESTPQPGAGDPVQAGSEDRVSEPVTNPNTPLQPITGPDTPEWDGAQRVTLLFMGLDYRDWVSGDGPPRTDTMILFSVDPLGRTAGILSIPRDLWVNIPDGFNYGRINTAYQLGEAFQWTGGGGPGLAMATVEELLGVPIDYYAMVDFYAFVRMIDEIGGVKIDVPEKIKIDLMGDNNTKTLKPGRQTLSGEYALAYARVRKTEGGDFDRASRQQQVILAIRDRILDSETLPTLISKSGILYNELSAGIRTNMSLDQLVRLAWLAAQIPEENIKRGIIAPPDQVLLYTTLDGSQEVLKPVTEKIRELRDEIFADPSSLAPAAANGDLASLVAAEGARVSVLNASYTAGLAAGTSDYLRALGINVTTTDNASAVLNTTEITFYTGKPYTLRYLTELMQISPYRIFHIYDPAHPVDIEVRLGVDWANTNPLP